MSKQSIHFFNEKCYLFVMFALNVISCTTSSSLIEELKDLQESKYAIHKSQKYEVIFFVVGQLKCTFTERFIKRTEHLI